MPTEFTYTVDGVRIRKNHTVYFMGNHGKIEWGIVDWVSDEPAVYLLACSDPQVLWIVPEVAFATEAAAMAAARAESKQGANDETGKD